MHYLFNIHLLNHIIKLQTLKLFCIILQEQVHQKRPVSKIFPGRKIIQLEMNTFINKLSISKFDF